MRDHDKKKAADASTRHAGRDNVKRASHSDKPKVKLSGVRKVWKVFKSTPIAAVSSALKKLTIATVGDKLTVRRKFKTTPGRKDRWWFTIRSDEETLLKLEKEWSDVELHTKWKIE